MNVKQFRARLAEHLPNSKLTVTSSADADDIASEFPQLPSEYFDLLTTVGCGSFGDGGYSIYSGPVPPADIYGDARADSLQSIVLVGDDFCGYCLGYRGSELGEVSDFGDWESLGDESLIQFLAGRLFADMP